MDRRFSLCVLCALMAAPAVLLGQDTDGDGISDSAEEQLLMRFEPQFLIDSSDCAGQPAELHPSEMHPRLLMTGGVVYTQAFPITFLGQTYVELHYFHIWSKDCGRIGHPWDIEHVSALTRDGEALYWLAAAHQDTLCDAGTAVRAARLEASRQGPTVWVSSGKHASFFSAEACNRGCGGDRCRRLTPWKPTARINLGEPSQLAMPSAGSSRWPLLQKMDTDFTPEILTALATRESTSTAPRLGPARAVISGGNSVLNSTGRAKQETDESVSLAQAKTTAALSSSGSKVRRFIGRSRAWVRERVK